MAELVTDTTSDNFDGMPISSYDETSYEDSYDDGNSPEIDLPGQKDGLDEFPGTNLISDEFPSQNVIPDEVPRRDGPGGN